MTASWNQWSSSFSTSFEGAREEEREPKTERSAIPPDSDDAPPTLRSHRSFELERIEWHADPAVAVPDEVLR